MTAPVQVGPSPVGGGPVPSLTHNELAVLRRAAEGETYAVIARGMGLVEKSVSKISFQLARKLGANNITHAVLLACQAGLLDGRPRRHGDHAGFRAHERRGEDPWACDSCAVGERAYRAARARNASQGT